MITIKIKSRRKNIQNQKTIQSKNVMKLPDNEVKKRTKALRLANEKLAQKAAFVKNNPAPVLRMGYNGKIIDSNPAAKKLLKKDLTGRYIYKLFSDLSRSTMNELFVRQGPQFEQRIGKEIFLFTLKKDESTHSFYVYGGKITQRRESEDMLKKQNKELIKKSISLTEARSQLEDKNYELEQANTKIQGLMEARTEFINRSAHDLITPITPILALIPTIKKQVKDKKILYDISILERNANYLKDIVNNLMSYLKSRTGKYNYTFKKTDIRKIIEEMLMSYEKVLNQHRIAVIKKIPKNLPLVELDALKITEVVQNLVSNALKFTPKGGKITINAEKLDNFINIKFKDTGIGMTKKTLSKLFIDFFKADEARHTTGQGLGLSICKEIIEDHKGNIWAESMGRGKGSTIMFNIPISQKR